MAYKFFSIPMAAPEAAEAELNRFLASMKVSGMEKHFVNDGANSCWAVAVQYGGASITAPSGTDAARNRVDYQQVLTPAEFTIYARLRTLRKEFADAQGVKLHAVLTNEQLAAIAKGQPRTLEDLGKIPGIGEKRIKDYGDAILAKRWEGEADAAGAKPF
jgi:superfamily II DNA helicase RecQ